MSVCNKSCLKAKLPIICAQPFQMSVNWKKNPAWALILPFYALNINLGDAIFQNIKVWNLKNSNKHNKKGS